MQHPALAVCLSTAVAGETIRVPIAVTGSWVKAGRHFSITLEDLQSIESNFRKRKNGRVVVDYEHASEMPSIARGGPVPAAGSVEHVEVIGSTLYGDLDLTKRARKLIEDGEYMYLSPAIDWGAEDKKTGDPQGATLTSIGLTNHPFLEELPEIVLSEFTHRPEVLAPIYARLSVGQTALLLSETAVELGDVDPEKVIQVPVPQSGNMKIKVKVQRKEKDDDQELRDQLADELALKDDTKVKAGKRKISAVIGHLKGETKTTTASLIFPKEDWKSEDDVKGWLKSHGKKTGIDETGSSYRARQIDPSEFEDDSFRTIELNSDVTGKFSDDTSHDELRQHIQREVSEYYGSGGSGLAPTGEPYVREVYDDYVIVSQGMKCFKVPYSKDSDDDIKLGKWKEVKQQWVNASEVMMKASELASAKKKILLVEDDFFLFRANGEVYKRGYENDEGIITLSETVELADQELKDKGLDNEKREDKQGKAVASDKDGVKDDKDLQKSLRKEAEKRGANSKSDSDDDAEDAVLADLNADGATQRIPRLKIRAMKSKDGAGKTKHQAVVAGDGKLVGYIAADDFSDYAAKFSEGKGGQRQSMSEIRKHVLSEVIQDATGRSLSEKQIVQLVEFAIENEDTVKVKSERAKATKILMSEALDESGGIDKKKLRNIWADERISNRDYVDFEDAVEAVDELIRKGRYIPRQRKSLIRMYLSDREAFEEMSAAQPVVMDFSTRGIGGTGEESDKTPDAELNRRIQSLRKEEPKLNYADAMTKVLASDKNLKADYDKAHSQKLM
jgi:Mu-like prophage I protein